MCILNSQPIYCSEQEKNQNQNNKPNHHHYQQKHKNKRKQRKPHKTKQNKTKYNLTSVLTFGLNDKKIQKPGGSLQKVNFKISSQAQRC